MKIESRFNLNEEVFYFNTKTLQIECGNVMQINYCEGVSGHKSFGFCIGKDYYHVDENRVFKTKGELLSFIDNIK